VGVVNVGYGTVDCLVNVDMGDRLPTDWLVRVQEDYFKAGPSMLQNTDFSQLIDEMDELGVERAILLSQFGDANSPAARFAARAPERFSLGLVDLDHLRPIRTLRTLESFCRDLPVSYALISPSFWGDGMYAGDDAVYYPLYTKACELDLPVCINTGLPGPPIPGEVQNPIHLDRVCHRFPELRLCMIHGADPWWDTAIRLMIKYANLHLMTSAWAPKYLPPVLLHYMRTRGKDKIMFASDSPVLSITRCLTEASALDLSDELMRNYLHDNAQRFFSLQSDEAKRDRA
jgi:predicted TIM-barrel fold metal-dependent hydrolase